MQFTQFKLFYNTIVVPFGYGGKPCALKLKTAMAMQQYSTVQQERLHRTLTFIAASLG